MVTLTKKQLQARLNAARQQPKARPNARRQPTSRPAPKLAGRKSGGGVVRVGGTIPKGLSAHHHFNAFGAQTPQALAYSIGPATHVAGFQTRQFSVTTGEDWMFVFQPSGGYDQLLAYKRLSVTWNLFGTYNILSTGITSVASSGSPAEVMCSRGSFRIRNYSRAADAGGLVKALRVSTAIGVDVGDINDLQNMIETNVRTRSYTGSSLTATHQWDCIPVSQSEYTNFEAPSSALVKAAGNHGLTSICFYMPRTGVTNDYEVSFAATYYARYQFTGPLMNMAKSPPTIGQHVINAIRDSAEAVGSAGMSLAKDALSAVPGYLGNLVRQNFATPGGRQSMITGIEEIAAIAL